MPQMPFLLMAYFRIVTAELRLQLFDSEKISSYKRRLLRSTEALAELDNTVNLGTTNLILFQQLGPAFTKITQQYEQVLHQIEFVKEDILSFSK